MRTGADSTSPAVRAAQAVRSIAAAVVLTRLARVARTRPPITADDLADPPPPISVVVPARDEATRIRPLLDALRGAPGVVEVVVVDDESSDDTAGIVAAAGARVVRGRPRPTGWAGKSWALQQGFEQASGDWVVSLDADTRPDPRLPLAVVARALADRLDLVTLAGRVDCPTAGAQWLHPAMLTTLVYRFGPPGPERPPPAARVMANGQCMVARRHELLAAGGLAPVAGAVVEDVALARHLAAQGWRVDFLDAADLLTVRMYESFVDTWRGWGRSLALPGVESRRRQLAETALVALTMPLPVVRVALRRADLVDALLVAARVGTLIGTRRAYVRGGPAYWCSPVADGVAVAALALGTLRRHQSWRGRRYKVSQA